MKKLVLFTAVFYSCMLFNRDSLVLANNRTEYFQGKNTLKNMRQNKNQIKTKRIRIIS